MSLLLIMTSVIALSYWLEEHTRWVAHISGVLLIIVIASLLSHADVVPSSVETYAWQFKWTVPLGIVLMLLAFNPKHILRIKKDFLLCFVIGTTATCIGGVIAGILFQKILPEDYWRISGQLTASFIGGYENAVSVGTSLNTPIPVFLKAFAGDSVLTSLWIVFNIFQSRDKIQLQDTNKNQTFNPDSFSNPLDITSVAITATVAFAILAISSYFSKIFQTVPLILWASMLATLTTFTPLRYRFSGSYIFGAFILSYFIFGCGAISNVPNLFNNATPILIFPAIIIIIHAIILFGIAKLLKIKKEIVIITSQCLIGGPATALAVATARKLNYQYEAVALGFLGYAVGNYFGFTVAWILK